MTIDQRLKNLMTELQNPRILKNQGNGNEIGYYIFDYDPEHESIVQQFALKIPQKLASNPAPLKSIELNLYQVMVAILEDRNMLQKAFDLEERKENDDLAKTMKSVVRPEKVVGKIQEMGKGDEDLIFLTGVGASWPILRSHPKPNALFLHFLVDNGK